MFETRLVFLFKPQNTLERYICADIENEQVPYEGRAFWSMLGLGISARRYPCLSSRSQELILIVGFKP